MINFLNFSTELGVTTLSLGCTGQVVIPFEPTSLEDYHDGYWVRKMRTPGFLFPVTVINDMYVNLDINLITVYAQSRVLGRVIAPEQVGPGESTESNGETVCFHQDTVYLNGKGQELMEADGTGNWWVKHSWVLDGEGCDYCEQRPAVAYDYCFWFEGNLMDDGLIMNIGGVCFGAENFNARMPVLNGDEVTYLVTHFKLSNTDPEVGKIDLSPMLQSIDLEM